MGSTFKLMFPESSEAAAFKCGETKARYLAAFGILPYLKSQLVENLGDNPYVVLFDESLNKKTQTKQLDVLLRFWGESGVETRYLGSEFMGHATADDLMAALESAMKPLKKKNCIQISMDGPTVNWAFYDRFQKKLHDDYNTQLINTGWTLHLAISILFSNVTGSCGLHQVHGAFLGGARVTGWDLDGSLRCLYTLFKHTPARREDFTKFTGCSTFPYKYCPTRYVSSCVCVPLFEYEL
jgi:hypothetical protein